MLQALCGVLFRSIRVSQVNSTIAGVSQLISLIRNVLQAEVDLTAVPLCLSYLWGKRGKEKGEGELEWIFSSKMKLRAMEKCGHDIEDAAIVLKMYLENLDGIKDKIGELDTHNRFDERERIQLSYMVFHMCEFDVAESVDLLEKVKAKVLLDLARRRCCYEGLELRLLGGEGQTETNLLKGGGRDHISKLSATIHLLQHTGESVAGLVSSQRYYVDVSGSGECQFDPRFLVFEFVSSFLLRKRQIALVKDFISSAREGKSSVQQVIFRITSFLFVFLFLFSLIKN